MRHIALIYDAKLPYDLKVISGIALYVQEVGEFITFTEEHALKNQKLRRALNKTGASAVVLDQATGAVLAQTGKQRSALLGSAIKPLLPLVQTNEVLAGSP